MPAGKDDQQRYLSFGIGIGVAIGCGLGIIFGNLALGIGPGIAVGVIFGIALAKKRASKADAAGGKNDAGGF
jgi:hypothetical protein